MPRKPKSKKTISSLKHDEAKRRNIPTAEYQSVMRNEEQSPIRLAYERRNRDLDPQLVWRGKDEQDWSDLVVQAPPLYIQEKVHPKVLIDDLLRRSKETAKAADPQLDLFADFNGLPDDSAKTEFYQHDANWSNRMILGDSLQVMASLAEREGLRGKVQCIYIDPPYGIKFNSNFQWSTTSRDVKDGKAEHITREPEQVKAFRDTWRDGIHSYLTYLRDRLTVARDLLADSGSIFVQIGDENVHRVRALMDEVFGEANFIAEIKFRTAWTRQSKTLDSLFDSIIWFSKSYENLKYRQLFYLDIDIDSERYDWYTLDGIEELEINILEKPKNSSSQYKRYFLRDLTSQGESSPGRFWLKFKGDSFFPRSGRSWSTRDEGLLRLQAASRLQSKGKNIFYKYFQEDARAQAISNMWDDTAKAGFLKQERNIYVVQTANSVIQRCILMTTDPGDLVLDPTCVREGTLVLAPLNPPEIGGKTSSTSEIGGKLNSLPDFGEGRGGVKNIPIESIRPGDWVYSHNGQPQQVLRVIRRNYRGRMIGIRHEASRQMLWLTADHRVLVKKRDYRFTGRRDWSHNLPSTFEKAGELRRNLTVTEKLLWNRLRNRQLGVKFRRQHPIGPYIVDFHCPERALIVEVDGNSHFTPEAMEYDLQRTAYLQAAGLQVIRFTNSDVRRNTEGVLQEIQRAIGEPVETFRESALWMEAGCLQEGDVIYFGVDLQAVKIIEIRSEESEDAVYDLEVKNTHSFLTEVCAVHNCGSGTTAYVAEQWGRRWITIDTSRVALALARARLMGACYPYYLLADSKEGQEKEAEITRSAPSEAPTYGDIRQGFVYERVPHITLKSIANNSEIDVIWEEFQPKVQNALKELNAALHGHEKSFKVTTGGRQGKSIDFTAPADATVKLPSGEEAPAGALLEWEVPRDFPEDWPEAARKPFEDFWKARIARQKEIDASIAAHADTEYLYDKPYEDSRKVRVAGPFTVESLSPHRVLAVDENDELIEGIRDGKRGYGKEYDFSQVILENLKSAGVQYAHKEDRIKFNSLTPWPGHFISAEGRYVVGGEDASHEKRAGIFIGPEFGTVSRPDLVAAAREAGDAGFDTLIACAFNYDAHSSEFEKLGRIPILKARMNADLHMADELQKTDKANLFVIFGEPDIDIIDAGNEQIKVKVNGVDVFHPQTGEVRSDGAEGIACWFIDTDYNEESFFVRHAYFLGASDPYKSLKTTLKAEINQEAWETLNSDTSRAFDKPASGRIAVKVINHLGDEVMKVFRIK